MTVLIGYSPTPEGEAAVHFGIRQAKAFGEDVLVLNAGEGREHDDPGIATEQQKDHVLDILKKSGVAFDLKQYVRGNDAAEEILQAAETADVSIIVIGSRKRSPVGKLIMGSTAQRIILGSSKPVVSVKAD
ncbi:universal stress protein [Sediminivirga luteola]|uniref:Universal stress protein n=2 Tax=Sediminivirga luteola TaxID=1774748 RepID=A0A8J2TV41_9MICO|nr:universal stress protein [Sediminivirga luteola]